MIDFDNLPEPQTFNNDSDGITKKTTHGTGIVSEFFSENVTYIECDEIDLSLLMANLNNPKFKSNLDMGIPGIETIEKNNEYIRMERSALIHNRIVKFEKGGEKEDSYNKLVKTTFFIFEDFIAATGDSKAIKNTMDFLSDILLFQLTPVIPTEIAMLRIPDRFETIENITIDRVKHTNIKKITIYGRAQDISDLDIKFPGYDVSSVTGVMNTKTDERRIKISKTGKISFYKLKDKPLYIEHLKFGHSLFFSE
ncbi:MAG: hypothetical protein M0R46_03070 [Candidatus Muirbacterium halophilum]|nr:hypothetical protein [Candidatus Muirbacterium halophilum]MCK9474872.1 hypothetical protein [Candidatus Muirbacterium halophilum]